MRIIGIDPGKETGVVCIDVDRVGDVGWIQAWSGAPAEAERELVDSLLGATGEDRVATHWVIERIAPYGMVVGRSVFDACEQVGRLAALGEHLGANVHLLTRHDVSMVLSPRGSRKTLKDAQVRCIMLSLWGEKGTKSAPGPLYGVTGHAMQALGVATAWMRRQPEFEWIWPA